MLIGCQEKNLAQIASNIGIMQQSLNTHVSALQTGMEQIEIIIMSLLELSKDWDILCLASLMKRL